MSRYLLIVCIAMFCAPHAFSQDVNSLKLKDYTPVSIYKIPQTPVSKAKFPVTDVHSHDYAKSAQQIDDWVKAMDAAGIEKTLILSHATGAKFDSLVEKYGRYKNRFDVWCGFDYTGFDSPEGQQHAVKELERCFSKGARGVGELGDKGLGELYSGSGGKGVHLNDPRMRPLLQKCAELHMPVNVHIAEDEWMYLDANAANDGLMNAATWKVDLTKKGILDHDQLIASLENAVKNNPATTFIACHLANCCANLGVLGRLLDTYPNLHADIAARYAEIAPIPRFTKSFIEKYQDRLLYGTDMGMDRQMYGITFRILETADEHFYEKEMFGYHWPLYGLALSDEALRKVYGENAKKLFNYGR